MNAKPKLINFNLDNIILDETTFENSDVKGILTHLDKIPRRVLEHDIMKNVKVKITGRLLTDLSELEHLKGVICQGRDYTWDYVDGTYWKPTRSVILSINPRTEEDSRKSVALHEYGHGVHEEYLTPAMLDEFKEIHNKDFSEASMPSWTKEQWSYFQDWKEYFAESFARYVLRSWFFRRVSNRVQDYFIKHLK